MAGKEKAKYYRKQTANEVTCFVWIGFCEGPRARRFFLKP